MVKGISRQVIVVQPSGSELFEQAIFILKENAPGEGVTDDMLLKEAKQAIRGSGRSRSGRYYLHGAVWASGGAVVTTLVWLATVLL